METELMPPKMRSRPGPPPTSPCIRNRFYRELDDEQNRSLWWRQAEIHTLVASNEVMFSVRADLTYCSFCSDLCCFHWAQLSAPSHSHSKPLASTSRCSAASKIITFQSGPKRFRLTGLTWRFPRRAAGQSLIKLKTLLESGGRLNWGMYSHKFTYTLCSPHFLKLNETKRLLF